MKLYFSMFCYNDQQSREILQVIESANVAMKFFTLMIMILRRTKIEAFNE